MRKGTTTGKPSYNFKDLTGQRFGQLTAVSYAGRNVSGSTQWLWKCDCGSQVIALSSNVKGGKSRSCGCLQRKLVAERVTTHGMTNTHEHMIWQGMIQRCKNPRHVSYKNYRARGITVCERWLSFENFFADMGLKPTPAHTVERLDNNKGYSPENCKWATRDEQAKNTRRNRMLTCNGLTMCMAEWIKRLGAPRGRIEGRLQRGWSVERALSTP